MRAVSLFSGAGGMDLGFDQAGFDLVWANDCYEDAVRTYERNLGNHVLLADVCSIPSGTIPDADVVLGGFPCQGFSVANIQRSPEDGRNDLYLEFVRVVSANQPRYFVAENVKGLLSLGGGEVLKTIIADFEACGYRVVYTVLNAADFGVPQRRERVFLLGVREDVRCDPDAFPPRPTHGERVNGAGDGRKPWVTVGEALAHLPEPESDHEIANHHDYSRYKLRFNGYLGHRRVDPAQPAPTITARGDMKGGVVVIHHPSNTRRVTPREAAIIQGFPEGFVFEGSRTSTYRQIANAVPPPVARAVAEAIKLMDGRGGSSVPSGARMEPNGQTVMV